MKADAYSLSAEEKHNKGHWLEAKSRICYYANLILVIKDVFIYNVFLYAEITTI